MNLPSLEKFAPKVQPGGVIVINESLVNRDPARDDCIVIKIAAREIAQQAGAPRAANLVMLGAYAAATEVVATGTIEHAIEQEFSGDKVKYAASSIAAFRAGVEAGRRARTGVGIR
jgi:2-oxoglutarate ferredoxin oxidoreductase subunit gamma